MSAMMPPGWSAHQSPDGRWYYFHAPTNVTQWHPPAPQSPAPGAAPPPPPPPPAYPDGGSHHHHKQHHHHHQQHHHGHPAGGGGASAAGPTPTAARYTYAEPVEFKLQEKLFSLSGDSFAIKRVGTGEPTFKVKGNALSLKDSKQLLDAAGAPLYKMTENLLSLRGRMHISAPGSSTPVVTLRKKGFIPMFGTSTIQAWRGASDDGDPWLEVKGDFFRKDFAVREKASGRTLATIRRKSMTWQNVLFEKDSYVIRVEPGNDAALLVFFVIAADEQYRDDGERRGYSSLF